MPTAHARIHEGIALRARRLGVQVISLSWLLPLAVLGCQPPTTRDTDARPCMSNTWSEPSRVVSDKERDLVFRDASLIELSKDVLIVGNNVPFFNAPLSTTSMLAVANLGGSSKAPPAGRFTFTAPLALNEREFDQTHLY